MRLRTVVAGLCLAVCPAVLDANTGPGRYQWEEYDRHIEARTSVASLGSDLFGDEVNLYNGALSFSATDVSLPGNFPIPVDLKRSFSVANRQGFHVNDAPFADWSLDVPHLSGVFAPTWPNDRCTGQRAAPTVHVGNTVYSAGDYWAGNQANMPGGGEMLLADQGAQKPSTGGPWLWMTPGLTYFSCLPSIKNGSGEGFLAITSDGTRYWFDHLAQYWEPRLESPVSPPPNPQALNRRRNVLYATRIEDRYGNWVTYTYTNASNQPARLTSIQASDGRQITLGYNTQGHIASANDGTRTWTYEYAFPSAGKGTLTGVVLPDGTRWGVDFRAFSDAEVQYDGDEPKSCNFPGPGSVRPDTPVGRLTHPSGAVGEFEVLARRHGRSNVPRFCANWEFPVNDPTNDVAYVPRAYGTLSLVRKRISGPGLQTMDWNYSYTATISWAAGTGPVCDSEDCLEPKCLSDDCAGSSRAVVTGPGGEWTRYTFGNSYRYNEGKLLRIERGTSASNILRTEQMNYVLAQTGQAFPTPIGRSLQVRGDGFSAEYLRPQRQRAVVQDGVTYESTVDSFDHLARPLQTTKRNSVAGNPSRTEVLAYHDNTSRWVMGSPARLTVNGIVAAEASYNGLAQMTALTEFGKPVQTLAYHADGTVHTVTDGRGNTTTLTQWKRGIPQTIRFPATAESPSGATRSGVVNDLGWITRITDENGFATQYQHDAMGRLSRITPPTGDEVAWNDTTFGFVRAGSSAYGIPAGHWQHTVSTGNGRKVSYLDALWRPLLVREYDTANPSGTQRFTRFTYDHAGRPLFASQPSASSTVAQGTWTEYDVLGRTTSVAQDSELGLLTTRTAYLADARGPYTRVTHPRNSQTLTWYQVFDEPSYEQPVAITHPEGAFTDIVRDVFGKPVSLTRRNATGSTTLTRRYVYDANQQLCKTIEPESGATIMAYDGAGNLAWSRAGSTLTSTTSCNTGNVPAAERTVRTYDARNRLLTLSFPDGRGNTTYTYTPDGRPSTVSVSNAGATVTTSYAYNRRRLPTGETLSVPGHNWAIGYAYNANGFLASHVLPDGEAIAYAPNALGQATQAGTYATNALYFPNGALRQFTYGNGIVRNVTQNARGLPDRSRDAFGSAAVYDDSFDYDAHGNVAAISDGLPGNRGDRTMVYDALDRLRQVDSPMFGRASYTYDVLDNLRTVNVTAGTRARNHVYAYDANNRLSTVSQGGGSVASLAYDAQGNLSNRNGQAYDFDFGNRLREVAGVEQYRYDGHGRRVQAIRNGASIFSVYGQDGVLRFQRDERAGQTMSFVHLAGTLVAQIKEPIPLATPTLTAPGSSSTGSYTVSWTTAPLASHYQLQERFNGGSWSTVHDGAGTSRAFTGKAAGTYGYRIRACSPATCGSWSAVAETLVQLPPTASPTLSAPTSGLNGSYTVSWTSVAAATTYQLQERFNGGSWSTVQDAAGTSRAFTGKATGNYEYRARGCNPAGCGPYSAIRAVEVIHPPASAPTLTAPATSYTGSYSLSWTAVGAATSYQLQQRKDGGSWSTIHDAAGTSKAVSGHTAGTYEFRARACNVAGCGAYSAIRSTVVTLPPTAAPTLTAPGTSYTGSYSLSWTAVGAATSYQLQQRKDGGSWSTIHDAAGTSKAVSGHTAGTYEFRVRACNVAGCAAYSTIQSTVVTLPPASAPSLTAPASNTTGSYSLSWTAVSAATSYQLQQRKDGGSWSTIHNAAGTSKAVTGHTPGTYEFRVRACNVAGCGAYSAIQSTQVSLPLTAPTLSAPASAVSGDEIVISWTAIATATSYELQQNRNGGAWSTIYDGPATQTTRWYGLDGNYGYQVRACNANGCSPYSAVRYVQVSASSCPRCGPNSQPALQQQENEATEDEA